MDQSINKNYFLGIKVLTPLHIGGGAEKNWTTGLDFVQNGNNVYKIDQHKLMSFFQDDPEELAEIFSGNAGISLRKKLGKKIDSVADEIFDFPFITSSELKAAIRTGVNNQPYIPGSSVKGAIGSILFKHFGGNQRNVKNIMGDTTEGSNFMRFIKVSDAHFKKTELVQTKIFNLFNRGNKWLGGWKHEHNNGTNQILSSTGRSNEEVNPRFAITYEVLPPQQTGQIVLNLAITQFKNFKAKMKYEFDSKMNALVSGGNSSIFKIINSHSKSYIDKEIDFLNKYSNKETHKIIETFEWLKSQIPEDNSFCLFKMAAGSGFHSITGDWQYDEYDLPVWKHGRNRGKKMYKSRKIAIWKEQNELHFSPMGFVLLAPLEILNRVGLTKEQLDKFKRLERKKIEEEKIRTEKEKQRKIEEKIAADLERKRLEMEVSAQNAFQNTSSIEQLELFCEKFRNSELLPTAKEKILILRQLANEEVSKNAQNEELTFIDFRFKVLKEYLNRYYKIYKKFKFSEKQTKQIADAINQSLKLENQNPKKSSFMKKGKPIPFNKFPWTDIVKWIGEEKAKKLFEKLNNN